MCAHAFLVCIEFQSRNYYNNDSTAHRNQEKHFDDFMSILMIIDGNASSDHGHCIKLIHVIILVPVDEELTFYTVTDIYFFFFILLLYVLNDD